MLLLVGEVQRGGKPIDRGAVREPPVTSLERPDRLAAETSSLGERLLRQPGREPIAA